jgi:hypothetical protein
MTCCNTTIFFFLFISLLRFAYSKKEINLTILSHFESSRNLSFLVGLRGELVVDWGLGKRSFLNHRKWDTNFTENGENLMVPRIMKFWRIISVTSPMWNSRKKGGTNCQNFTKNFKNPHDFRGFLMDFWQILNSWNCLRLPRFVKK